MPAAKKTPTFAPPPVAWGNTLPCVATYNVLEHDDKMDQFEDQDHPFADAGTLTMGELRFHCAASGHEYERTRFLPAGP